MAWFQKKKETGTYDHDRLTPAIRSSICTGEQTLCARDKETGKLQELVLITDPSYLEGLCDANGLSAAEIRKVY